MQRAQTWVCSDSCPLSQWCWSNHIILTQGSKLCLQCSQAVSSPLNLQGSPLLLDCESTNQGSSKVIRRDWSSTEIQLVSISHSVVSNSLQRHGLQPARLLCPWNSPGKNARLGSHSLLQGLLLSQRSKPGLLHCKQIFFLLESHINLTVSHIKAGTLSSSLLESHHLTQG